MTEPRTDLPRPVKYAGPTLLEYGFRPFFLGAGVNAALAMLAWLAWIVLLGADALPERLSVAVPAHQWHAHEMIFGYGLAVVAGFFLTAVPNWTGRSPVRGRTLGILFGLWLAARATSWTSAVLPPLLVALPELAFVAMLTRLVAQALLSGWSRRNFIFLPVLLATFAATLLYHLGFREMAHLLGIDTLLVLITVIGGRIVPAFTTNALRRAGSTPLPRPADRRDALALAAMVALTMADVVAPGTALTGAIAILAGLLALFRMLGWRTDRTLDSPIVWILHLGYAWLAFGLLLKGGALTTGALSEVTALHALTIGAIGSMTVGVMTRAALGHTGRPLVVPLGVTAAYIAISLAAVLRICAELLPSALYDLATLLSGALWIGAFLAFSVIYWPILTRPRLTARPDSAPAE